MRTDGSDQDEKIKSLERSPVQGLKELINSEYAKKRFMEVMGDKSAGFIASVLNAVQKNPELAKCDPRTVLSSAMVAATLDLPIDSNLGFSAIIPYNTKIRDRDGEERWVSLAQFQIMYKGFIQLALRSGQYKTINISPIYEDEFESCDIITGDILIHPVEGGYREQENEEKIVGYAAFFRLLNGYERKEFWSLKKIQAHGKRYSKSYDHKNGLWKKNPHAMYAKTVLKNTLSKWGILSVTMQNAMAVDQSVIKDFTKPIDSDNVNYIDNMEGEASISESGSSPEEESDRGNAPEMAGHSPEQVPVNRGNTREPPAQQAATAPNRNSAPPQPDRNPSRRGGALFPADEAADLDGIEPPDFGN